MAVDPGIAEPHGSLLHFFVLFQVKMLCFHICRGFLCPAKAFSCKIVSAFWGGRGCQSKALNISCTLGLHCSPECMCLGGGAICKR